MALMAEIIVLIMTRDTKTNVEKRRNRHWTSSVEQVVPPNISIGTNVTIDNNDDRNANDNKCSTNNDNDRDNN